MTLISVWCYTATGGARGCTHLQVGNKVLHLCTVQVCVCVCVCVCVSVSLDHRLAGEIIERFDPKRNADQLQQCLSKLLRLFNQNLCHSSNGKRESSAALASEWAEAESYYLLTNLGNLSMTHP